MENRTASEVTARQQAVLIALANAIVDSVKAAGPEGAPGGVVYAALSAQGCSLAQFDFIMGALVHVGKLTKSGNLYRAAGGAS
jgi:hypothetical protein